MTYHLILNMRNMMGDIYETVTAYPLLAHPRILVVFVLLNL